MRTIAILIMACVCNGPIAQARIWTNTEGKTVEAELVKVEYGQVYLKLAGNGAIRPLKIEWLSEADREFVRQHEQEKAARQEAEERAKRQAEWLEDYDEVKAEAEKLELPILLLYTAPDWCGPCRRLESNVLKSSGFMEFADQELVLWIVDCSDSGDKEDWLEENKTIAETCRLEYYPMMYFLSSDLRKLGMIGSYQPEWDVAQYIEEIKKVIHP